MNDKGVSRTAPTTHGLLKPEWSHKGEGLLRGSRKCIPNTKLLNNCVIVLMLWQVKLVVKKVVDFAIFLRKDMV